MQFRKVGLVNFYPIKNNPKINIIYEDRFFQKPPLIDSSITHRFQLHIKLFIINFNNRLLTINDKNFVEFCIIFTKLDKILCATKILLYNTYSKFIWRKLTNHVITVFRQKL